MAVKCGITKWPDDLMSEGTVNARVSLFIGIATRKYIFV